jgi:hypothetical protein
MLCRVALVITDVSEELSASCIRVTRMGELGTTLAVTSNRRTLRPRLRLCVPCGRLRHNWNIQIQDGINDAIWNQRNATPTLSTGAHTSVRNIMLVSCNVKCSESKCHLCRGSGSSAIALPNTPTGLTTHRLDQTAMHYAMTMPV